MQMTTEKRKTYSYENKIGEYRSIIWSFTEKYFTQSKHREYNYF